MAYPSKCCRPVGLWSWGTSRLKAYVLAADPNDVDSTVLNSARVALDAAAAQHEPTGAAGFAIVHRCGMQHLLLACTWRNENELWESVWEDSSGAFVLLDRRQAHLPTYCVWEMGIVTHETRAWRQLLDDGISHVSLDLYFDNRLTGVV